MIVAVQVRIQTGQLTQAMNSLTAGQELCLLAPGGGGGVWLVRAELLPLPVLVSHSLHGVVPSILMGCGPGLASVSSLRHPVTDNIPGLAV